MGKRRTPPKDDGPEIYAIRKGEKGWRLSRRGLLQAAASAAGGAALVGSARGANCPEASRAHLAPVTALAVYANGTRLASASRDKTVKLWSLPDGALLKTITLTQEAAGVSVSPDSTLLVTGSSGDGVKIYSLPDASLVSTLSAPGYFSPSCLAVNSAATIIAAGSANRVIQLWSFPSGAHLKTLQDDAWVGMLALSPDGALLASAGPLNTNTKLWSVAQGTVTKTLAGSGMFMEAIAMRPDGSALATCGTDGVIQLWSLPGGEPIASIPSTFGPSDPLTFSPDGRLLVATKISRPQLWDFSSRTLVTTATPESLPIITSTAITPDGEFLIAGCMEVIGIYSLPDLRLVPRCLVDPAASGPTAELIRYTKDGTEYTLPCGSPIPAGAVCTCNCVPGAGCPCVNHSTGGGHYWFPN